jgi:hypothetical protein
MVAAMLTVITNPPYVNMMYYGENGTYADIDEYKAFLQDTKEKRGNVAAFAPSPASPMGLRL